VHTNYYGTSKKNLEDALVAGRSPMLLVDVQGAEEIRKKLGANVYSIFIVPPSMEDLEQRLRARATDAEAVIQKRLQNAAAEMDRQGEFDSVLVNDDLNVAYQNLILILQSIPR
jgi:guanylate kinase